MPTHEGRDCRRRWPGARYQRRHRRAATIRCVLDGVDVLGIQDGFEWIMQGNIDHVLPLKSTG